MDVLPKERFQVLSFVKSLLFKYEFPSTNSVQTTKSLEPNCHQCGNTGLESMSAVRSISIGEDDSDNSCIYEFHEYEELSLSYTIKLPSGEIKGESSILPEAFAGAFNFLGLGDFA